MIESNDSEKRPFPDVFEGMDIASLWESKPDLREPAREGVYFIRCGEFVKIGITSDLKSRMKGIETHNPFPLELLALLTPLDGVSRRDAERWLHEKFAEHRHRCEWFRLVPEILDFIATLKARETGA